MAKNRVLATGDVIDGKAVTSGAPNDPFKSGDPVKLGAALAGVALKNATDTIANGGTAPIALVGVYTLSVKAHNGTANTAVAIGDKLYYDTGANGPVNVNSGGAPIGVALAAVNSGSTTSIQVLLGH